MPREIEMKFKVASHADAQRLLKSAGAEYLYTVVQNDRYFDTPERNLLKADCGMRMRKTRLVKSGSAGPELRIQLTYKGPRQEGSPAKMRHEYQRFVDKASEIQKLLKPYGLQEMLTVEKRRASYRLGKCLVELDTLPILGEFIEIEGPSSRAVQRVREIIGLGKAKPLLDHYISLAQRRCRRVGKSCGQLAFRTCRLDSRGRCAFNRKTAGKGKGKVKTRAKVKTRKPRRRR